MGNWRMEVGRMAMYMSFPVLMFHYFNQPQYFEDWVTTTKRNIYPPENPDDRKAVENLVKEMKQKHLASLEN